MCIWNSNLTGCLCVYSLNSAILLQNYLTPLPCWKWWEYNLIKGTRNPNPLTFCHPPGSSSSLISTLLTLVLTLTSLASLSPDPSTVPRSCGPGVDQCFGPLIQLNWGQFFQKELYRNIWIHFKKYNSCHMQEDPI